MNNYIFKKLFSVLVSTIFILPINASFGGEDPIPPLPGSPQPNIGAIATQAPAPLTDIQKQSLSQLLARSIDEIQKIHVLFGNTEGFSDDYPDDKKIKIIVHDIKKCFHKLLPVFLHKFQRRGVHYTPENTAANGTHLHDIKGNPSTLFTSKGPADFLKSVGADNFFLVSTHFGNTYFIPKWMIQPNKGFGLYQQATLTLHEGVVYSEYNVLRMLNGQNPLSHSGVTEIHHAYQNQETVCYLCHSEHKRRFKEYHKSERETLINRAIASSEAYYINKLTALLTLAKATAHILKDEDSVSYETSNHLGFIKEYRGNLTIIPNGTEVKFKKSTKLREGFDRTIAENAQQAARLEVSDTAHVTALEDSDDTSDSVHVAALEDSDDATEVFAFPASGLSLGRDSFSSGRTSFASEFGTSDDSNSRDSITSSSSFAQRIRRVSISSAATDTLSSDEEVPSVVRKKIVAKRGVAGKQRSTSSVTQGIQDMSIAEAPQKPTQQPEKRSLTERNKADLEDPLIDKENKEINSPALKRSGRISGRRASAILREPNP